ncbi:uncharacterized protein DAT39_009798, partial [Clarias magur]
MDKLHSTFLLQTLLAFFTPCLLEFTSADVRSVRPGENITLPCNITDYPEISWYRLRSDEVKLLVSAEEWKLRKTYYPSYKVNESHINVAESRGSVSLVITGVRETDLGFYYCCGGRTDATHTQFGKPIRLNFTGFFKSSLLQIISADYKSVHPGENITLHCNITNYSEIFWYRLRSEELEHLLSAERTKLDKDSYLVVYNVDESHFDVPDSSSSVSLVIIGVREADLGFYYCGGRNDATHTQFGKHIRLNFT